MNLCNGNNFGKRNLPKHAVTKNIYIFYCNDCDINPCLKSISDELIRSNSCWLMKYYPYDLDINYRKILKKINTPYHDYNKTLDKLCIIDKNKTDFIKKPKLKIKYFLNIRSFELWINELRAS